MHRREFGLAWVAGATAFSQSLGAADEATDKAGDKDRWGDLTATFVYDGQLPERKSLKVDRDQAIYKDPIFDASLIVDQKSKGIANVVSWLHLAHDAKPPAIHPDYDEAFKKVVCLEIANGQLMPRITLIRTEQELLIQNKERVGYNLKTDLFLNAANSELTPAGGVLRKKYHRQEGRPSPMTCAIHSWLSGHILIRDHPYMGLSNDLGQLTINNLPVGKHTFTFWHERSGFVTAVKRDKKAETWKLGRLEVEIKPGKNDLGVIACDSKQFKER